MNTHYKNLHTAGTMMDAIMFKVFFEGRAQDHLRDDFNLVFDLLILLQRKTESGWYDYQINSTRRN